jgi:hypothetical protein
VGWPTIYVIGIKQINTITKSIKPSKRACHLRKIGENIRKYLKKETQCPIRFKAMIYNKTGR